MMFKRASGELKQCQGELLETQKQLRHLESCDAMLRQEAEQVKIHYDGCAKQLKHYERMLADSREELARSEAKTASTRACRFAVSLWTSNAHVSA